MIQQNILKLQRMKLINNMIYQNNIMMEKKYIIKSNKF